jgi:hypothetical protein
MSNKLALFVIADKIESLFPIEAEQIRELLNVFDLVKADKSIRLAALYVYGVETLGLRPLVVRERIEEHFPELWDAEVIGQINDSKKKVPGRYHAAAWPDKMKAHVKSLFSR